jgi:hypothetical protein
LAITGATIGKIGIVHRYSELTYSGDLLRLRASNAIDAFYLLLVLDSPIGEFQFKRWITGSTNGHLASRELGRILIPRLGKEAEARLSDLVILSLRMRLESERLLDQATARVEQLIEEAAV